MIIISKHLSSSRLNPEDILSLSIISDLEEPVIISVATSIISLHRNVHYQVLLLLCVIELTVNLPREIKLARFNDFISSPILGHHRYRSLIIRT